MSVFVTGDSCVLSTRSNRLQLWRDDVKLAEFPWRSLQSVVMFGPHHITSPASSTALFYDVPVHYASSSGKYRGVLWNGEPGEMGHRFWLDQVLLFEDSSAVISAACSLVVSRIRHMREVLRQYGKTVEKQRNQMQKALRKLSSVADLSVLNGIEGNATRAYFSALQCILPTELGFTERKRRPLLIRLIFYFLWVIPFCISM